MRTMFWITAATAAALAASGFAPLSDPVTTRWTWYQDRRESWMEEIRLVRKQPAH